ncbi:MAG: hypothetical protein VX837_04615, partial [Candidatus Thermoplasmatota archaeon]|nr:hypothetical protein [Candidatus Thermoplasmatota archaeon]
EKKKELRLQAAKSSDHYLQQTVLSPDYEDIQAGRNSVAQVKAHILEDKKVGAVDDPKPIVAPKPAVSAGGGGVTPNPVVYIGGDVGGQVQPTAGGGTATGTSDTGAVVKKKKLLGS